MPRAWRAPHTGWLVGILLLGAALRFQGLNWDGGRGYHPDEGNLVRAALALGWPDRLIPAFHAYNDLALWMPRLISGLLCAAPDETCVRLAARGLSALASTGMILAAADVARRLSAPAQADRAMLWAAALVALSAPLLQWAHFGTTESALALVVLILWGIALRFITNDIGVRRAAILSGLVLGLAFGLKTTALAMAVIPLAALIVGPRGPWRHWLAALAVGGLLAVALGLAAAPSLILAPQSWLATMQFEAAVVRGDIDVFWTRQFVTARAGLYELRQLWGMTEGVGLLLALAGLARLPPDARRRALPGLAFALVYGLIVTLWYARFSRYLAPLMPIILVFAAQGAASLVAQTRARTLRAAVICGLGVHALTGLDRAAGYQATDPRTLGEHRLDDMAAAQDLIAVEPHDIALSAGRPTVTLALDSLTGDDAVRSLAATLASADWYVIASRRNWAVLPGHPATRDPACGFYAALAEGRLGFQPRAAVHRAAPFGGLLSPGLGAEETRSVFDRPMVVILENRAHLGPQEMAAAIAAPITPDACSPGRIARALERDW